MRKDKLLANTILIAFVPIIFVISLTIYAKDTSYQGGGFTRSFNTLISIIPLDTIPLDNAEKWYLAGSNASEIYLGSQTRPAVLLSINLENKKQNITSINTNYTGQITVSAARLAVENSNLFLSDGSGPLILRGKLDSRTTDDPIPTRHYFTDFYPLSRTSAIIRSISKRRQNIFGKLDLTTGDAIFDPTILKRQVDGIFCTNGSTQVDRKNNRMVFVYTYRNEFVVTDTSLNLKYIGSTIDTTRKVKVKVLDNRNSTNRYLASPPIIVNRTISVSENILFINSSMVGDEDDNQILQDSSPIDMYDLNFGDYGGSFLIPNFKNKRFVEFAVLNNSILIAVYPDGLVIWNLIHISND